jgi:hypothetical protein
LGSRSGMHARRHGWPAGWVVGSLLTLCVRIRVQTKRTHAHAYAACVVRIPKQQQISGYAPDCNLGRALRCAAQRSSMIGARRACNMLHATGVPCSTTWCRMQRRTAKRHESIAASVTQLVRGRVQCSHGKGTLRHRASRARLGRQQRARPEAPAPRVSDVVCSTAAPKGRSSAMLPAVRCATP